MVDIEQPPPPRAFPQARREAVRDMLIEEVRQGTPWWRRSRRSLTIGLGAVALVFGGGAAATAAYVTFQPASDLHSVYCYSSADPDAGNRFRAAVGRETTLTGVGTPGGAAEAARSAPLEVDDPVALCSQAWELGVVRPEGSGPPAPSAIGNRHQVPDLTACTLRDGVAGVFPGGDGTCTELNLPRLDQ